MRGTVKRWDISCRSLSVFIQLYSYVASCLACPQGSYFSILFHGILNTCVECPNGSFMPYTDHQETVCRTCEIIVDSELEILVSPCNKTHDAVIHCVEGYYRDLARNPRETGTCQRCTKCSDYNMYTGLPCSTYRDSVCCMDENFDVAPNHHGVPLCRERPWFCRQGHYFDTTGYQCLPCPSNTFIPVDFHVHTECFKCGNYTMFEVNSPLHSVIVQPCNSTHDTVLRCQEGFFIKYTMGYRHDAIGCFLCTDCNTTDFQHEGRKCDGMQDTVCCPQPNMTVVDTSDGPVCQRSSKSCGTGRCQMHNTRKKTVMCVPCDVISEEYDAADDKGEGHANVSTVHVTAEDNLDLKTLDAGHSQVNKSCEKNTDPGLTAALFFIGLVFGMDLGFE